MCESTSVPSELNQDIVIPWTCFNVKESNWGQSNLMGPGPGLSYTHHFTRISPCSWRTCWSSWASEPLWRKHSQHSNKHERTYWGLVFNKTLQTPNNTQFLFICGVLNLNFFYFSVTEVTLCCVNRFIQNVKQSVPLHCSVEVYFFGCLPLKTRLPFLKTTHSCILMARIQNILHHIWTVPACYIIPHPVQLQAHSQHFLDLFSVFRQWQWIGLPLVLVDLGVLALMHPRNKYRWNEMYIREVLTHSPSHH